MGSIPIARRYKRRAPSNEEHPLCSAKEASVAKGLVYGVGMGPGDPELITLKAIRVIRACPVIAVPGSAASESLAYQIALAAVPEVAAKELVALPSPMVRNPRQVAAEHTKNAELLEHYLDAGQDVAFLTLGDPSIYSTFGYLRRALEADGYQMSTVSGVPSFCAAAACLGLLLAEGDEPFHVVPAGRIDGTESLIGTGTHVVMKAGSRMHEVKALLGEASLTAQAVERCGMEGQKTYRTLEAIPDDAGYFTLVIANSR